MVKLKSVLKNVLVLTMGSLAIHQVAQAQDPVADKVWLMTTTANASAQGVSYNYLKWPAEAIAERAKSNLLIDEITFTSKGWNILFSKKFTAQKVSHKWDNEFYKNAKAEGLSLSEIAYGDGNWRVVMSNMPDPGLNGYITGKTWDEALTKIKGNSKTKVYKVAFGGGQWIFITTQGMGLNEQTFASAVNFPTNWVNTQQKAGYAITDAAYAQGKWHVVMSKTATASKTKYYISDKWEYKLLWDRKESLAMVHYAYDYDKAKANADKYSAAASAAFAKNDYKTAILNYTNAINENGYGAINYKNRGAAKYNLEQYEGALADLTYVLKNFDANDLYALRLRAFTHEKLGKYKEVVEDYTTAIAAQKDKSKQLEYFEGRSAAFEKLGEYAKAIADMNSALSIKPGDAKYTQAKSRLNGLVQSNKPVITWDVPFNANTTVDKAQFRIAACVNSSKESIKSVKILVNGKEVSRDTRGFTVEETCTENVAQNIALANGSNTIEIVVTTNNAEVRSEKRIVNFNTKRSQNNYHALLIGVNDYTDPAISKLNKPVKDVEDLQRILTTKYTFANEDVHVLKNPTKAQIAAKFRELKSNLTEKDNLLVFYAGHGTIDSVEDKLYRTMEYNGYWLPKDAKMNNKATWVENSEVYDYISQIPAKHTLVVADACFSGSLLNAGKKRAVLSASQQEKNLAYNCDILAQNASLKAMTSGNLTEVPDKSLFMASFLNALESNTDPCMPADDLFYLVNKIMRRNQVGQEPKYQPFESEKHQNGEFIFKKK